MFGFFFFQAEDGIRDADVTGVQTCALPILQRQYALYGTLVEILKDEKEFVVKLPFVGGDVNRDRKSVV